VMADRASDSTRGIDCEGIVTVWAKWPHNREEDAIIIEDRMDMLLMVSVKRVGDVLLSDIASSHLDTSFCGGERTV